MWRNGAGIGAKQIPLDRRRYFNQYNQTLATGPATAQGVEPMANPQPNPNPAGHYAPLPATLCTVTAGSATLYLHLITLLIHQVCHFSSLRHGKCNLSFRRDVT